MIAKEKVLKVIRDFCEVQNEKAHKEKTGDLLKDLKKSDKEINLRNYISALPYDEVVDLCALMDYGRECDRTGVREVRPDMFRQMRKNFIEDHPYDEHLAGYLLAKFRLNRYLRYALALYDEGLEGF